VSFGAPFYISKQYFDIKKRKGGGVRTSLVLSEHASTVRCLVRVCVLSRNFEEQNNEEAKAIRGAISDRQGGGVRTSLVLSEHASTVRCLVRVCVLSRNFEEQNNEEAKAIRGAI